tara:strand:- start:15518 stop:15691 length:174 start_codon:yes stop_codon:yes gene_type:complete
MSLSDEVKDLELEAEDLKVEVSDLEVKVEELEAVNGALQDQISELEQRDLLEEVSKE